MKKLVLVFGVLGFFFAGFVSAQESESIFLEIEHLKEDDNEYVCNPLEDRLLESCIKALGAKNSAGTLVRGSDDYLSFEFEGSDLEEREKNINLDKKSAESFVKGLLMIAEIQNNDDYSDFQKEKLFIDAADFFEKAEKLERKPVIYSGGILPGPGEEQDGTDYFVTGFLTKFINGSILLMFSIGVIMMIIGGIMFLVSAGDSEQITKAKDTLIWGIVGVTIAVLSFAIVKFIVGLDLI